MDYLAGGETVDFADIQNDIYYLLDKGSYVVMKLAPAPTTKATGTTLILSTTDRLALTVDERFSTRPN